MVLANALPDASGSPNAPSREVAARLGLTATLTQWLGRPGAPAWGDLERYLEPRLAHLSSPDTMADRSVVARRLASAVRRRERVVVFGDYDCDGITSAVILTEALRQLGGQATPLFASRFEGGYGVSEPARARIAAAGCDLLVTCDCGSSDHATLGRLVAEGVEVIVIDHHLVPEQPLPALGFLNPHRSDCGFADKGMASCGLVLSVVAAVRNALGRNLDVRQWLDLVAIGTIADVAPLRGDNRALVRAGLRALGHARRPGVAALLKLARVSRNLPMSGRDVAFRLAPLINAPGRLGPPDVAARLLLARQKPEAEALAQQVFALCTRRREHQAQMVSEAEQEIERSGFSAQGAIVIGREEWNPGIVGIVAGRLADRYGVPTAVVGFEGGVGRGSVRGPAGSRLHAALSSCSALLERFGGHQQAAGFEVKRERLDALRERFAEAIAAQGPPEAVAAEACVDLDPGDDPVRVLTDFDRLEPCGEGNPRPRLRIDGHALDARMVGDSHLKLTVGLAMNRRLPCFAPRLGDLVGKLGAGRPLRLVGDLRHSDFPGTGPVEFLAESVDLEA